MNNKSFITRTSSNFNNFNALRNLYFAFDTSHLEYTYLMLYFNNFRVT